MEWWNDFPWCSVHRGGAKTCGAKTFGGSQRSLRLGDRCCAEAGNVDFVSSDDDGGSGSGGSGGENNDNNNNDSNNDDDDGDDDDDDDDGGGGGGGVGGDVGMDTKLQVLQGKEEVLKCDWGVLAWRQTASMSWMMRSRKLQLESWA